MATEVLHPLSTLSTSLPTAHLDDQANKVMRKYILIACGASILPYAIVDVISTTVIQYLMVQELCKTYHVPYEGYLKQVAVWLPKRLLRQ